MDIIIFIYYMIYTFCKKIGDFGYNASPFKKSINDRDALENVSIIVTNGTGAMYIFWLSLYSLNIYVWLPKIGLGHLQALLLSVASSDAIVVCILFLLSAISYFIIFYHDRYLKYFEKFKKMGCFLTFIYSIVGLTLIVLPVILLFAAIVN